MGEAAVRKMALLLVVTLAGIGLATAPVTADEPVEAQLLISEIQTGGSESANQEFVELYNPADQPLDIAGWQLLYKPADGGAWETKFTAPQAATVAATGYFLIHTDALELDAVSDEVPRAAFNGGLASGGGHVCLVGAEAEKSHCDKQNESDDIVFADLVGWGTAHAPLGTAAPAPARGESISRCLDKEGLVNNTHDNAADFAVLAAPAPGAGIACAELPGDTDDPPENPACNAIRINEILPNAAGADSGHEFIELYNPTAEALSLYGCGLAVNDGSAFWFTEDAQLAPHTYLALYDSATGLTLPNTSGGTVYLLTGSNEDPQELDGVMYEPSLDDDVAWAWFDEDRWEATYAPTPNAANIRQPTKPCPEGEVRNANTGRCRTIQSQEDSLKPCGEGRERNPETNRCRKIGSSGGQLKPCDPGEKRNPQTNRCRQIGSTTADLKPCAPHQERNPETNRCRNVAGANTGALPEIHDIQAVSTGTPFRWWIAGGAVAAAGAVGVWEWRRDAAALLIKAKNRLKSP
jgi:hypothetical protein